MGLPDSPPKTLSTRPCTSAMMSSGQVPAIPSVGICSSASVVKPRAV